MRFTNIIVLGLLSIAVQVAKSEGKGKGKSKSGADKHEEIASHLEAWEKWLSSWCGAR